MKTKTYAQVELELQELTQRLHEQNLPTTIANYVRAANEDPPILSTRYRPYNGSTMYKTLVKHEFITPIPNPQPDYYI